MKINILLFLLVAYLANCAVLMSHEQVMAARENARDNFAEVHKQEIDRLIAELNANVSDILRVMVRTHIEPPFALHVLLAGLGASYDMEYDVAKHELVVDILKSEARLKLYEPGWHIEHCRRGMYNSCGHVEHGIYEFNSREQFEHLYALNKFYSFS